MKVKDLIEQLQKYDLEQEVIIRFALDNEDDVGYVLIPFYTGLYFEDECAIYAKYTATKEDCEFIGQVDLKETYEKMKEDWHMTKEQAEKVLEELNSVRPEMLNGEAKRLFEAIMKIADKKDELYKKVQEQNKIIDLMSEMLNNHDIDEDICKQMGQKENCNEFTDKENCKACIKQYFKNKLKK